MASMTLTLRRFRRAVPFVLFAVLFGCFQSLGLRFSWRPNALHSQPSDKVAVCFFGLTRSLRNYTYESIQTQLLDKLHQQNLTADIFLHTYLIDGVLNNPRTNERNVTLSKDEWKLLRPLRADVENMSTVDESLDFDAYLRYGNAWPEDPSATTLRNLVRQLRSIRRCWELVDAYSSETGTKYRYVMFARPDVLYLEPGLPNLSELVPSSPQQRVLGIAFEDRFAVGHPDVAKVWALRGDYAFDFMSGKHTGKQRQLHSESLVRYALTHENITAVAFPLCFVRVRASGVLHQGDQMMCEKKDLVVWRWGTL